MRGNLFWLSDEQWCRIAPHLPRDVRGKERVDDRRVISGILHVLKSGCRWCDCPPEYGPPTTLYNRFARWAERGVWERLSANSRRMADQLPAVDADGATVVHKRLRPSDRPYLGNAPRLKG